MEMTIEVKFILTKKKKKKKKKEKKKKIRISKEVTKDYIYQGRV